MVEFTCDLQGQATPLRHVWEHTLGSGHAALALRADWQAQLRRCHDELGVRHVRFHGILDDDLGTLICENDSTTRPEVGRPNEVAGRKMVKINMFLTC